MVKRSRALEAGETSSPYGSPRRKRFRAFGTSSTPLEPPIVRHPDLTVGRPLKQGTRVRCEERPGQSLSSRADLGRLDDRLGHGYRRGGEKTEIKAGAPFASFRGSESVLAKPDFGQRNWWPYLVDPASSHMLVSKIKPCMSKYILLHSETANGSLNQLWFIRWYNPTWITVVILELIHATKLRPHGKSAFIRSKPIGRKAVRFGDSG